MPVVLVKVSTRPVALTFSAAADGRSLVIDRETQLVAVSAAATGNTLISWDPSATIANTVTAPANVQLSTVIAVVTGGTGGSQLQNQLNIPLSAGEVIYVSRSGSGIAILYFQDPS